MRILTLFAVTLSLSIIAQQTEDFANETISSTVITTDTGLVVSSDLTWDAYTNNLTAGSVTLEAPSTKIIPQSLSNYFEITLSNTDDYFTTIGFDLWLNGSGTDKGCACRSYDSNDQELQFLTKDSTVTAKRFEFTLGNIAKIRCNAEAPSGSDNLHVDDITFSTNTYPDILLNGTISAENNQIKNVVDPTEAQDAATKSYVDSNTNSFSGSYSDLTNKPDVYTKAQTYSQSEVDALIADLQSQIDQSEQSSTGEGYKTFGNDKWALTNAENKTYRDGTPIQEVSNNSDWTSLTTGAWCYYGNDPKKGKLYNWFAVMGIHDTDPNTPHKEFAPAGHKVPTQVDWEDLVMVISELHPTNISISVKMASQNDWSSSSTNNTPGFSFYANNYSEFNVLPKGWRHNGDGQFRDFHQKAVIAGVTLRTDDEAEFYCTDIQKSSGSVNTTAAFGKGAGVSVRLIKVD